MSADIARNSLSTATDLQTAIDGCNQQYEGAGLSLESAAPPFTVADQKSMAAAALDKSQECARAANRTTATRNCARQCSGAAIYLDTDGTGNLKAAENSLQFCNNAYAEAGFAGATKPALAPTQDEQVATLPAKAAFCSNIMAGLTCSSADFLDRQSLCTSARACEVACAHPNMAADLTSKIRTVRIKAQQKLGHCDRNYDQVMKLQGGG